MPPQMDKLEETDKFLEKYNFPKLTQEEIEDLNRPIRSKDIKTVIRNLPANKSPGLCVLSVMNETTFTSLICKVTQLRS